MILLGLLIAISIIDLRHRLILDVLTLPGIAAGLIWGVGGWTGLAVGFFPLYLLALFYLHMNGKEGIGGGDVKLMAMVGAWIGWSDVAIVQVSAIVNCIIMGRMMGLPTVPFAPFVLASVIWVEYLYGQ